MSTRWIIEDRKWKLDKSKKKAGGVKPPIQVNWEIGGIREKSRADRDASATNLVDLAVEDGGDLLDFAH